MLYIHRYVGITGCIGAYGEAHAYNCNYKYMYIRSIGSAAWSTWRYIHISIYLFMYTQIYIYIYI